MSESNGEFAARLLRGEKNPKAREEIIRFAFDPRYSKYERLKREVRMLTVLLWVLLTPLICSAGALLVAQIAWWLR